MQKEYIQFNENSLWVGDEQDTGVFHVTDMHNGKITLKPDTK